MSGSLITIVRQGTSAPAARVGETVISTDDLKRWLQTGRALGALFRWSESRLLTDRVATMGRPLTAALAARLFSRGDCVAVDAFGGSRPLSASLLAHWAGRAIAEPWMRGALLRGVERNVAALESTPVPHRCGLDRAAPPVYIRADVSFGLKAGGSVAHTAGVVNHLSDAGVAPIVLVTDRVPLLRADLEIHDIAPDEDFWNFRELPSFVINRAVERTAAQALGARRTAFVYQRYALNGYAALALARQRTVPLVTEYNGSEVWVARHWGRPLRHESLSRRIEELNLRASHLVTVVSEPLAADVARLGVEPRRILVNPNGVDTDRYRPDVDGSAVRAHYGLGGRVVVGFIGTFGPWHGADVLADAFVRLIAQRPDFRDRVRLLWIGDGVGLPRVKTIVDEGGVASACTFAGLVPQSSGAEYLAACDILASPHVPNPDGTPFFGSPTKLFEYMAMGRAVVASELDQVGEILEHGRLGQMVPPGDAAALAAGLAALVDDPERRAQLGAEARRAVVERHTWRAHVRRTIDALATVMDADRGQASAS